MNTENVRDCVAGPTRQPGSLGFGCARAGRPRPREIEEISQAVPGCAREVSAAADQMAVRGVWGQLEPCLAGVEPGGEDGRSLCLDALGAQIAGCEATSETCFAVCTP